MKKTILTFFWVSVSMMTLGCKVHKDLHDVTNEKTSNHTTDSSAEKTSSSVDTSGTTTIISTVITDEHAEENKTTVTERFDSLGRLTERTTENVHTTKGKKQDEKTEQRDSVESSVVMAQDSSHIVIEDSDHQIHHETDKATDVKVSFPVWTYILIALAIVFMLIWFRSGAHDVAVQWIKKQLRKISEK